MSTKANIQIDKDGCIGCAMCVSTCPDVFAMGDDGKATVVGETTQANEANVKAAADGCPVNVIFL